MMTKSLADNTHVEICPQLRASRYELVVDRTPVRQSPGFISQLEIVSVVSPKFMPFSNIFIYVFIFCKSLHMQSPQEEQSQVVKPKGFTQTPIILKIPEI